VRSTGKGSGRHRSPAVRRTGWVTAVTTFVLLAGVLSAVPVQRSHAAGGGEISQTDAELQPFQAALQKYVALRQTISTEIPPLSVTDRAEEIVRTSDAAARAIERARSGAAQGEFFTPPVAKILRERLRKVAAAVDVRDVIAPEGDERATLSRVRVHARFPQASPLPTMPTSVLDVLPAVPKGLEYRLIGTTLILRDIEAAIILDYLPDAFR
jgi:hypothetical protein